MIEIYPESSASYTPMSLDTEPSVKKDQGRASLCRCPSMYTKPLDPRCKPENLSREREIYIYIFIYIHTQVISRLIKWGSSRVGREVGSEPRQIGVDLVDDQVDPRCATRGVLQLRDATRDVAAREDEARCSLGFPKEDGSRYMVSFVVSPTMNGSVPNGSQITVTQ